MRLPARLLTLVATAALFAACNKEKPTTAIITIQDEDGFIVPNAYVKLYANPTYPLGDPTRLTQEKMTDAQGRASFDYTDFYKQGQAGFAVLDIVSFKDSAVGQGIIKILEEETNEETVVLVPVTP
ncbi:MAG: hypothetical protein JNL05_08230 [Flavobacteriales bacterium]|jgi:hypothetical protein|nr:hypothetical protein [Flavobacteriales bacterium]